MVEWRLRPREDDNIYAPSECPNYSSTGFFTIKLYHGGVLTTNPKGYVGGEFRYVDSCNIDHMGILEVYAMLKECGQFGHHDLYYKLARTYWERGLWSLENDGDVLDMCELIEIANPKAADREKGCERVVKARTNKTTKDATTHATQEGSQGTSAHEANQQMGGDRSKGPRKTSRKSSPVATTKVSNLVEGSQGGVFTQRRKLTPKKNTPLGIQPENFDATGSVTSLKKMEEARQARINLRKKFAENAAWKY